MERISPPHPFSHHAIPNHISTNFHSHLNKSFIFWVETSDINGAKQCVNQPVMDSERKKCHGWKHTTKRDTQASWLTATISFLSYNYKIIQGNMRN